MTTIHQEGAGSNDLRTTADWARTYAQAGARVLPLRPQAKVPALKDWPSNATTDPEQVQAWFSHGNANLGLAMGTWGKSDTYLVCIDLDVHEADKNGLEAWQRLTEQHGEQGAPFIADTATGGMHLVYQSPVPISNNAGALAPGIDIRGEGGQIMVQPSTHPHTGTSPQWRGTAWQQGEPGLIPQWLLELITTQTTAPARTVVPEYVRPLQQPGDTRPGDEYNRTHTWHQVLANDGWTDLGNNNWLRPGKTAERNQAPSAVLYPQHGEHGVLVVFTSNAPAQLLRQEFATTTGGHHKLTSPWAYEVAMRHGGDFVQAARTVGQELRRNDEHALGQLISADNGEPHSIGRDRAGGFIDEWKLGQTTSADNDAHQVAQPEPGHSFRLQTLDALIGVPFEPIMPTLLCYDGQERGLFYPNAHNLVAAPGGVGKSWIQAVTMHQQIVRGLHVAVIDYEMNMRNWFDRFRTLGATDSELSLVHYCQPDEALEVVQAYGVRYLTQALQMLTNELQRISELGTLSYVCIDGVTNAMVANTLNMSDNADVAKFWALLPQRIVQLTGAGVGLCDHVPKGAKGDAVMPLGGQHKVAVTTGSAFTARAVSALYKYPHPHDGDIIMRCIKDRHGEVGAQGSELAHVVLSPTRQGLITYQVLPYSGDAVNVANTQRDKVLQAISELNQAGQRATLSVVANMSGCSNKTTCKTHLDVLANMGHVINAGSQSNHDWRTVSAPQVADTNDTDLWG